MEFVPVTHMDEVLEAALREPSEEQERGLATPAARGLRAPLAPSHG